MWCYFLQEFSGSTPIVLQRQKFFIHTDASGNPKLGCGGWFHEQWFLDPWLSDWLQSSNFSIDFLEMFAVLLALWIWKENFINATLCVFCDNQPVIAALNSKMSGSKDMMLLLRYIVLTCTHHNIWLYSVYKSSKDNAKTDALSYLQINRFLDLHPNAESKPQELPGFLSPLSESTLNNLRL